MNIQKYFYLAQLLLAVSISLSTQMVNAEHTVLEPIIVEDKAKTNVPFATSTIDQTTIQLKNPATSDTASILNNTAGVTINNTGGLSSLPSIQGLADDRLRIKLDGMDLTATCPNHMNPPLSYIAPSNVEKVDVYAGITPVSVGGDSIGGAIIVESLKPEFATNAEEKIINGQINSYYRSNNDAMSVNINAGLANQDVSINYSGSWSQADNYTAADNFKSSNATGRTGHTLPLDELGSTAYETQDHTLAFAYKSGENLFDMKLAYQDMPEQLYPNQRMDLLDNEQKRINVGWTKQFQWGELETRAYFETVDHFMNFGADKQFLYGTAPGMPMYSEGDTTGLIVKANYELSDKDNLRFGAEYLRYRLDDYWPASGTGMMSPNTFVNINDGQRDRIAIFSEWESRLNQNWMALLGIRYERVDSDAGNVQGYANTNMMGSNQLTESSAFNASDHDKADNNVDLTALARYHHDANLDIAMGFARKVRSPNLYERYTWSSWAMAAGMNNFVGDGNGYVGNLDLDPEKAYTLSTTFDWHTTDRSWEFKATPFYTHVVDYIDATKRTGWQANTFNVLQYQNQSARIYGIDLSGKLNLGSNALGEWGLDALFNYSNGENRDTGDNLYNIMPLNGKLTLNQQYRGWYNSIEWLMVKNKDQVSEVRNEIQTPGYMLLNLRASHTWKQLQINLGIENLFDHFYYLPTGGTYLGQGSTMRLNPAMGGPAWGTAVPGMGRSLYAGINISF
ncbi:MAG: TonB-dependent receptor [Proteobacteria bacterium]|nr:TonB-dependent receptor [Pseudomonadota bacterium]NOG61576.1 TonB-dependent receptor [Pseudomonadota bacterium]